MVENSISFSLPATFPAGGGFTLQCEIVIKNETFGKAEIHSRSFLKHRIVIEFSLFCQVLNSNGFHPPGNKLLA